MGTSIDAATTTQIEHAPDAATRWPQFTAREVGRLRFLAYCRRTGRLRRPTPVSVEVEALGAGLLADPAWPDAGGRQTMRPTVYAALAPTPARQSVLGGVPATWAAWSERYGTLRPADAGGPAHRPYPYARWARREPVADWTYRPGDAPAGWG